MENEQQHKPKEIKPLSQFQNPLEWNNEPIIIIDGSVYRTIWYEPVETFKKLIAAQDGEWVKRQIITLFVLGGIVRAIDRVGYKLTDRSDATAFGSVMLAVTVGALFGWIFFYIYSGVLCWTASKILGGTAEEDDYKTILAWSIVPMIVSVVFSLLNIFVFHDSESSQFISYTMIAAELLLAVWTLVLLVKGIKVIQSFSTLKAIINIVLPSILFIAFLFGIGYVIRFALGVDNGIGE